MRKLFDEIFTDHRRVRGSAATSQDDSLHSAQFRVGHVQAAELRCGFFTRQSAAHCITDCVRLLENLFEHEVRIFSLVHFLLREFYRSDLIAALASEQRGDLKAVWRQRC